MIWLNFINHANGPFQDHTSFQERWPYNVLSWLLSLLPYQFNPVQNKHSLHWFIHFPPKFRLVLVYDAQSRITRVWSVFKEKSVIFSQNNADGLIQVAMKPRPRNYRVLYIGSALFPPDLTLKIRCVLYASAHNTQRSTVHIDLLTTACIGHPGCARVVPHGKTSRWLQFRSFGWGFTVVNRQN